MSNNSRLKNLLQQSFDNHDVGNSNDGWTKINTRLSFQNYLKFGIKHVNIYNTSLCVCLLSFLYVNIFTNMLNPELKTTNEIALTSIQKQQSKTSIESSIPKTYNHTAAKKTILPQKISSHTVISKDSVSNNIIASAESNSALQNTADNKTISNEGIEKIKSITEPLNQKAAELIAIQKTNYNTSSEEQLKKYEKPQWAVDLYTFPVFSDAMAVNHNSSYETVRKKVAAGISLKCMYKKYLFETGFVYRSQSKDFNQTTFENTWTTYTYTDTKEIYNTNLITGKSYKASVDTMTRTEKKINTIENKVSAVNTYSTMEIPLFLGYRLKYKKFASSSKFGLITYINKTAVGKIVKSDNVTIEELSNIPITSANYMFSISNSFCYKLRGPVNIFAEPYLKIGLNDPKYHDLSIGSEKLTYGLKMGIEIVL